MIVECLQSYLFTKDTTTLAETAGPDQSKLGLHVEGVGVQQSHRVPC